ncbi:MAG: NADH-quinone oxidoreductase subunit C [Acidobacteriia bacterium]|nr:NADH-quinone oxidoreductase subunit C [Terriglobia bacterium]
MPDEIKKDPPATPPGGAGPGHPSVSEKRLATKAAAAASTPWTSPLVEELQKQFPGVVIEAHTMVSQSVVVVQSAAILQVASFMRTNALTPFDYLVDVTAVDYPDREKRFDLVYVLHSFEKNERVRLKMYVGENEEVASVTGIWPTADWLEREVFDMFGVRFSGHPNLTRILLPEGWKGHPLRKDYHIQQMDDDWVRANLNIETGQ